MTSIQDHFEI